jgi:hypothetical protein
MLHAPNIPQEIRVAAMRYANLHEVETGGGCDYIARELPGHQSHGQMLLMAPGDGGSPFTLDEPCEVWFRHRDNQEAGWAFEFPNSHAAMAFMAAPLGAEYRL